MCIHRCQAPSVKEFVPEEQEAEAVDTAFTVETPVEEFKSSSPLQEEPESEPEELHEEEEEPRDSSEAEEEPDPITQQPQSITSTSVSRTDSPVMYLLCPALNFKYHNTGPPAFILNWLFYLCVHLLSILHTKYIKLPLELSTQCSYASYCIDHIFSLC